MSTAESVRKMLSVATAILANKFPVLQEGFNAIALDVISENDHPEQKKLLMSVGNHLEARVSFILLDKEQCLSIAEKLQRVAASLSDKAQSQGPKKRLRLVGKD